MTKPLTNLSIRVNIPEEKEYKVKEETVVLWERVIFAGLLMVAIIAGGVALLVWPTDDKAPVALGSNPSEPVSAPLQSVLQPSDSVGGQQVNKQQALDVGVVQAVGTTAKAKVQLVEPRTDTAPVAKTPPIPAPALSQAEPSVTVDSGTDERLLANRAAEASALVDKESVKDADDTQRDSPPAVDLPLAQVNSHSKHMLRAALATAVSGREPGNNAAAVLYVPKDQLLTVYFFTELDGLRKQTVHYDWFRNDKRVARVKIRPRFDTTGNFSSKYINTQMLGQWRVTAQTADGELLASARFEVR
ncbi:MAG TPA: DUF2914 domain-containing protein [Marinagarivorans sp.]